MFKILLTLFLALTLHAKNPTYSVKYHGMTLGEVSDLSTLKDFYLKAKVTSRVARWMLGKDYLVYYSGEKPDIKDAKFKKDKKMIVRAFAASLESRPKFKRFEISDLKNITLECQGEKCSFTYYKQDKVNGKGKIIFDESGAFRSITEEMSNFEIVRN